MTCGGLELLVLLEKLFDLVLKGFRSVLGHLIPEKIKDTVGETIPALSLLIPVILEGSRVKVADDAGDVDIGALENLPGKRGPKV